MCRNGLAENQTLPTLTTALTRTRGDAPRSEFRQIVRGLYDAVERNRYGLKLLARTARDQPDLAALWFKGARDGLLAALTEYLKREMRRGTMKEMPDVSVAARFIIETVVFWGSIVIGTRTRRLLTMQPLGKRPFSSSSRFAQGVNIHG